MIVPAYFPVIPASAVKVAQPTSSLSIGIPAVNGTNHLLGHCLGGPRILQNCQGPASANGGTVTYRFKSYRHPNCDYVAVFVFVSATISQGTSTIQVQAGTGTAKTRTYVPGDYSTIDVPFIVPWHSSDSGDAQITVTCAANINVASISAFDLPRLHIESTDTRLSTHDDTHTRIGVEEGNYLAESDTCGPHGMVQRIEDAWDEYQPQIVAWSEDCGSTTNAFTTTSASYVNILGGTVGAFQHRARQKKSGTTTATSRWHIYSWCESGTSTEYQLRVTSSTGGSAVESAALSNTTGSWQTALSNVAIDNTADDDLTVDVKRTAGTGEVYVTAISGIEDA